MARQREMVPYGYQPSERLNKGTLFVIDSFEKYTLSSLSSLYRFSEERSFARVVLYPLHEQTLKRMGVEVDGPYFHRVREVKEAIDEMGAERWITIDEWEGKRKKYTPLDTSLRSLTERYEGPHFVYWNDDYANRFAGYASFEEWIRKLRMFIVKKIPHSLHPMLRKYEHRWEWVREE